MAAIITLLSPLLRSVRAGDASHCDALIESCSVGGLKSNEKLKIILLIILYVFDKYACNITRSTTKQTMENLYFNETESFYAVQVASTRANI